jgi:hypothetical protein
MHWHDRLDPRKRDGTVTNMLVTKMSSSGLWNPDPFSC